MIPDLEKIASAWLREQLHVRVVGKPPADTATSWIRVVQLDAQAEPNSIPEHLISYLLQLDCYSGRDGGQPEANALATQVRYGLVHQLPGQHNGAVITAARIAGDIRLPDETFEPARDRRVLTATIWAHR